MLDHTHLIYRNQFVTSMGFYLHTKRFTSCTNRFYEIFAMGSQDYENFHFRLLLRKSIDIYEFPPKNRLYLFLDIKSI